VFVSVVIAAHDRPLLLREAVESVRRQTYPHWELIVVDDGSRLPLQLGELRLTLGKPVHLVRHATPLGIPAAKNAGLRVAKGDLILHLDDDDLLAPSALQLIVAAFEDHPDLDCLFLNVAPFGRFAATAAVNQDSALRRVLSIAGGTTDDGLTMFGPALFEGLVKTVPIAFQRPVARRKAWDRAGHHREMLFFSEPNWALRAAMRLRCALLREPVSRWRVNGQNYASRSELRELHIETLIACSRDLIESFARDEDVPRRYVQLLRVRLAEFYFELAAHRSGHGKPGGLRALLNGVRAAPRLGLTRQFARCFFRSAISLSRGRSANVVPVGVPAAAPCLGDRSTTRQSSLRDQARS
jgi:glycosyltransferase involved in cell wall biosynthesis